MKYINVSKLDSAARQLDTAIRLFLTNSDTVSIHTLTSASHEVMYNLCEKQGIESFIKDQALMHIAPSFKDEYIKMIRKPQNYFKHADKDDEDPLKFFYEGTHFLIWDASRMYFSLTTEKTELMTAFDIWFYLKYPESLLDQNYFEACLEIQKRHALSTENRSGFLKIIPELIEFKAQSGRLRVL